MEKAFGSTVIIHYDYEGTYFDSFGTEAQPGEEMSSISVIRFSTPLGSMFAGAVDSGICLLEFGDRRSLSTELNELSKLFKARIRYCDHPYFDDLGRQLDEYFIGDRQKFDLPLFAPGSDFQKKVWDRLLQIPYGETTTYGKLALELDNPGSVRAVGKANGSNRISIIIPCHRVIGEDGSLTGYGGGLKRKRWLLDFEAKNTGKAMQLRLPFD